MTTNVATVSGDHPYGTWARASGTSPDGGKFRLSHRLRIKNNLELSRRHPLTQKALVIFRFGAAVEATNCIVLDLSGKYLAHLYVGG